MKNLTRNNIFWLVILVIVVAAFLVPQRFASSQASIDYSEFQELVAEQLGRVRLLAS